MIPIDAVLVTFRSEDVIEDAVRATQALGGEVVVVEHGDGASALRASPLGATVLEDPSNPGFGSGQNRGVARTSTAYVLLCNPDTDIVPAAVVAGAALLDARPDVAAVQGVIVNQTTGEPERSAGVELGPLHLLGRALGLRRLLRLPAIQAMARRVPSLRDHVQRVPTGPVEVESLAATVVLVRRSAFDGVGGFDESYFLYGEDLDGWKLVAVPEIWATHANGASAESSCGREISWWGGTVTFAARWWSVSAWRVAFAATMLAGARLTLRHPARAGDAFNSMVIQPARTRRRNTGAAKQRARGIRSGKAKVALP